MREVLGACIGDTCYWTFLDLLFGDKIVLFVENLSLHIVLRSDVTDLTYCFPPSHLSNSRSRAFLIAFGLSSVFAMQKYGKDLDYAN